jgi:hypothetical protein
MRFDCPKIFEHPAIRFDATAALALPQLQHRATLPTSTIRGDDA